MGTSIGVVVGDSISFLGYIVLCVFQLFILITFTDLEADMVAAKDVTDQINPFVMPAYLFHFFLTVLALTCGKYVQFIFQLVPLLYHIQLYSTQKHHLDFLIIRRSDELKKQTSITSIELVNYICMFIWCFVRFLHHIPNIFISIYIFMYILTLSTFISPFLVLL